MTHFENGLGVISTTRDGNEHIGQHSVQMFDNSNIQSTNRIPLPKYTYIDKDGDGLFDILIEWSTNAMSSLFFTRSNLSWIAVKK
jgi:hypothetical protein